MTLNFREALRLNGDPGVIRTPGLRLRRQSLYPLSYGAVEVSTVEI